MALTHQAKVLIVNDGDPSQAGLAPLLSSRGYQVDHATTGAEALELFDIAPRIATADPLQRFLVTG